MNIWFYIRKIFALILLALLIGGAIDVDKYIEAFVVFALMMVEVITMADGPHK